MLTAFLIGAALGALTGIPIGPVNAAVIDTAYRHHLKRALSVGFGGASADMVYAYLGIVAISPYLTKYPAVEPILYGISGVVLVAYGVMTAKAKPRENNVDQVTQTGAPYFWQGFGLGVALIFLNPGTLITWVFIVGTHMADYTHMEGTLAAIGVGVGSCAWFTFVGFLANKGKRILGERTIWVTRFIGISLASYGVFLLGRLLWQFLS